MKWIKKFTKVILITLFSVSFFSLEGSGYKGSLKGKLDKKLKLEFISKGGWHTDFDQAKKAAREQGKPIFAYFTRSYAP